MGVIFRDESNDGNWLIICYNDATVLFSNHVVKDFIRFIKVPSAGFWSWFCKIVLFDTIISGQSSF
jgi:hypothetical protein